MRVLGVRSLVVVRGTRDDRVAAVAALQRGRISRRQLHAVGVTDNMIRTMCAGGRLRRLYLGVYAVGHDAPVDLGLETAALLASAGGAVLSHRSAAGLWRLIPGGADEPVDVTTSGSGGHAQPGIRLHRTRHLPDRDVRIHQGLPVTSPARTLLDYAGEAGQEEFEQALDDALARKLVRMSQIDDVLARASHGRKGAGLLRAAYRARTGESPALTRSWGERRLRDLLRRANLPAPEMNVDLHGYVPDLLWREERLIVEVDGWAFHRGRAKFEADRRRDASLVAAGWLVLRFTARQIRDEPYAVIARIAQTLGWRAASLGRAA
ncbi:MAG: DUF559 domain-containing protein [Solirubrobacterales bacterium]|nr:DUF559 domain-containing protein [Solirubrobacterales bacterium]